MSTKTFIEATPEEIVSRVAAANESIIRKVVNEQNRPEPFIGVPEAAKIFAVSQANIRKKCTENLIPHYQEFEKSPIRFKAVISKGLEVCLFLSSSKIKKSLFNRLAVSWESFSLLEFLVEAMNVLGGVYFSISEIELSSAINSFPLKVPTRYCPPDPPATL